MVLENNCFQFLNSYYKQVNGTAMGSPMAPAYSNIFMSYLWENKIAPNLPITPIWLRRYMDDIITILTDDDAHVPLETYLNSCHPRVKFTVSTPSQSVPFLDTLTQITDNKIHTDLYTKPTDSHRYISPKSNHPPHTFESIVYGQTLRLRRICSTTETFAKRASELASHLINSGYTKKTLAPIMTKVHSLDRKTLLSKTPTSKNQNRIPFINTFCPQAPNLHQIHLEHKHILEASETMKRIAPEPPLISYRRTPNLGNLLFNTKPPRKQEPGTHTCTDKRCKLNQHLITGTEITSTHTHTTNTQSLTTSAATPNKLYMSSHVSNATSNIQAKLHSHSDPE